jgi:hypothetical protein
MNENDTRKGNYKTAYLNPAISSTKNFVILFLVIQFR